MKIPVFQVLGWGCRDGLRAAGQFPILVLLMFLTAVAQDWLNAVLPGRLPLGKDALEFVVTLGGGLVLIPLTIPMYRFLLRGDTDPLSGFALASRRLWLSVAVYGVFVFLTIAPIFSITGTIGADAVSIIAVLAFLAVLALMALLLVLTAALALTFPAIAVDATAAELPGKVRAMRGNFWRMLLILMLLAVPIMVWVIGAQELGLTSSDQAARNARWWLMMGASSLGLTVFELALVGVSSRLYRLLAESPPEATEPAAALAA